MLEEFRCRQLVHLPKIHTARAQARQACLITIASPSHGPLLTDSTLSVDQSALYADTTHAHAGMVRQTSAPAATPAAGAAAAAADTVLLRCLLVAVEIKDNAAVACASRAGAHAACLEQGRLLLPQPCLDVAQLSLCTMLWALSASFIWLPVLGGSSHVGHVQAMKSNAGGIPMGSAPPCGHTPAATASAHPPARPGRPAGQPAQPDQDSMTANPRC